MELNVKNRIFIVVNIPKIFRKTKNNTPVEILWFHADYFNDIFIVGFSKLQIFKNCRLWRGPNPQPINSSWNSARV